MPDPELDRARARSISNIGNIGNIGNISNVGIIGNISGINRCTSSRDGSAQGSSRKLAAAPGDVSPRCSAQNRRIERLATAA